ncbi:MAG TPA: patatin-like phospholipase family protein [Polyangiaceae bacterium]|jgi:NTE family protein
MATGTGRSRKSNPSLSSLSSVSSLPSAPKRAKHDEHRVALVLAGGAARGAYEVGVVQYVLEEIPRDIGCDVPLDILCGTSAGSINACMLAAHADKPRARAAMLAERWTSLRLEDVVRPSPGEMLQLAGRLVGRAPKRDRKVHDKREGRRGGIFDPSGVETIIRDAIPFDRIADHLNEGRIAALSISTTQVASGRTVVFVQRREGGTPRWGSDPTMVGRAAIIREEHVLASAAVPLLFPAVEIDGEFYCDGGLRQNVPLSPARRLGANGLVVVNPRFIRDQTPTPAEAGAHERAYPDPLFVLGKAMNALLLDRIENDIDRLERLNAVLAAGERRYGPGFGPAINEELAKVGVGALRQMDVVYVRASEDIGVLAAEYVQSAAFSKRVRGLMARALKRVAEGESEADLLSYVLFDGEFAGRLIEMGRRDAKRRHDALAAFFAKRCPQ